MLLDETITRFMEDRRQKGCTAGTVRTYGDQFRLFQEWAHARQLCTTEGFTFEILMTYLAEMRTRPNRKCLGTLSPVTIKKRALGLRVLFNFAHQQQFIPTNPAQHLTTLKAGKRKPKALSPEHVAQLLDTARWDIDEYLVRDFAMLLFLLDSGVRLAELVALNVEDVDLNRGQVHVQHGKGDLERYTVFTEMTGEALRQYRPPHRVGDGLFVDVNGKRLTCRKAYLAVKRRAAQTNLSRQVSPHKLRHTFATEYLNNNGNIFVLQRIIGHANITTTQNYLGNAVLPAQREHARFSPLRVLQPAAG